MYIVTQLTSKTEKAQLQNAFLSLDKNADGKLSREELEAAYRDVHTDEQTVAKDIDTIMRNVDTDHNGYIDYSGI